MDRSISRFVESCITDIEIGKGSLVLDMPCGFGRHAQRLAQVGATIIAADIDSKRVYATHSLRTPVMAVNAVVADCEARLPFRADIFDAVVIVHYYSSNFLARAFQVLKVGGHIIFETFGAQGQNWRSLPAIGATREILAPNFDVLILEERIVGPLRANAVVRSLARRRS